MPFLLFAHSLLLSMSLFHLYLEGIPPHQDIVSGVELNAREAFRFTAGSF